MAATVAVKFAEVLLAGTVTDAGTEREALLLEIPTVLPPDEAAWLRVTVQVVEEPEFTLVGLQASPETRVGATRFRVSLATVPFKVAMTVTLWLVVREPAVAMKLAELAPAGTVTIAGAVNSALLSDRATTMLARVTSFKPTEHVVDAPEVSVAGLQLNDIRASGKAVMVPPVAVKGSEPPDWVAPSELTILIGAVVASGEIVAVTTATTPSGIVFALRPFVFTPVKKHV